MLLFLAADDSRDDLRGELTETLSKGPEELAPGLFRTDRHSPLPRLAFARQLLPAAQAVQAPSIKAWSTVVTEAVVGVLPDHQPWSLHVYPFVPIESSGRMGARKWHSRGREGERRPAASSSKPAGAGQQRCDLVAAAVREALTKRRRHLLHALRPSPGVFGEYESLVQLLLTSPDDGYLSVAPAPLPFEERLSLSPFPAGRVTPEADKSAPSRAYLKLLEAEARLGVRISARETCVDLGASPGGWTYVAARRGARVTAVDRSELRDDLMKLPHVRFQRGDAFGFEPTAPVDWLICDVIAAAERSAELLLRWLERGWCRRFVVTIKLADGAAPAVLAPLRRELTRLAPEHYLLRLGHNKKEVCAFGTATTTSGEA